MCVTGSGTLSYQWMKDGMAITDDEYPTCTGANTPSLCIQCFSYEHKGSYKCVVSSEVGCVHSTSVTLKSKMLTMVY